jgi:hypothetical protein
MQFEVREDLIFNEPLPKGGDTKIVLKKGTIVSYASKSDMSADDKSWVDSIMKRKQLPTWGGATSGPQRQIPFEWNGKIRIANTPNDLKPVHSRGLIHRFR